MPSDPNRGIPYPTGTNFVDEGPAEMEAIANAVGALNAGDVDFMQPGVISLASDWAMTVEVENSATCALRTSTSTGGTSWLPSTALGLMRAVNTPTTLTALKPPSLPAAGKFMAAAIVLEGTSWGKPAIVSIVSGVEKTLQFEAEANPATVAATKLRLLDLFIHNTAGVYSIVSREDRRPLTLSKMQPQIVQRSTLFTAQPGELALCTATVTAQLPVAPPTNSVFNFFNGGGAGVVTTITTSGLISGDFVNERNFLRLQSHQHLALMFNGTEFIIIAGEPMREQGYVSSAPAVGSTVTPSAARPSFVVVQFSLTGAPSLATLALDGITSAEWNSQNGRCNIGFYVSPNGTWSIAQVFGTVSALGARTTIL